MSNQELKLDLAYKLESNFINSFRCVDDIKDAVFWEDDTTAGFITGYTDPYLNCVFKFNSNSANVTDEIKQVIKRFKDRQCPASWFVGRHTLNPELIKETLKNLGLKHSNTSGNYVGMEMDKSKFHYSQALPELRIERVDNKVKIKDFLKPFQIGFEMPEQSVNYFELYMQSRLKNPNREGWFIGYVDQAPASISGYFIDSDVIMIHSVATIPEYRRKGYARRMNEVILSETSKFGDLPVTIYGSKMSTNLYRNMGFSDLYVMENYLFQPST